MPDCIACAPSRNRSLRPAESKVTTQGSFRVVRTACSATTRPLTLAMVADASTVMLRLDWCVEDLLLLLHAMNRVFLNMGINSLGRSTDLSTLPQWCKSNAAAHPPLAD